MPGRRSCCCCRSVEWKEIQIDKGSSVKPEASASRSRLDAKHSFAILNRDPVRLVCSLEVLKHNNITRANQDQDDTQHITNTAAC